jgi:hypothetical protein
MPDSLSYVTKFPCLFKPQVAGLHSLGTAGNCHGIGECRVASSAQSTPVQESGPLRRSQTDLIITRIIRSHMTRHSTNTGANIRPPIEDRDITFRLSPDNPLVSQNRFSRVKTYSSLCVHSSGGNAGTKWFSNGHAL